MQQEVKPVYGSHQTALHKQLNFFQDMGRLKRRKTKCDAEKNDHRPRYVRNPTFHAESIAQSGSCTFQREPTRKDRE